ncbi:MAG TPA: FlgD immunoglobulin-like domain containing protein, partial [Ignavibacteriaceae bacterium]
NVIDHNFYIVRDSTNPLFNITFDGKEIINGDLVSSKPEVVITLKDNSPLPLDTSDFTLIHTADGYASILHFNDPNLQYTYTQYPNSEARIVWHPDLNEGEHILEILAKDASGNFFDTTSYRITFSVVTEYDLRDVYNYPNPFKDGTYFTFKITGDQPPDELYVKIYTVAGRLIRTIYIPHSELGQDLGFKKVYWDGRDEDGDRIANGVYFYKMIYKVKDVVKSVTQKLAKIQ